MSRLSFPSRGPAALLLAGAAVLGLYLLLLVASFADGSFAGSEVGRNIAFAGEPVSGIAFDELETHISARAEGFRTTTVIVDAGEGAVASTTGELGLSVAVGGSVDAIRDTNRSSLIVRPFAWVGSFFGTREVRPRYEVDEAHLHDTLLGLEVPGITEWRLPAIDADESGVRLVPGASGRGIDADELADQLIDRAEDATSLGEELRVEPTLVELAPPVSDAEAQAAAAEAEAATARPLEVTVGEVTRPVEVATLRSWLVLELDENGADWGLDHDAVTEGIESQFADAGNIGSDVAFVVEGDQLAVVPGANRTSCCEPDSAERIEDALRRGSRSIRLSLISEETVRGSGWAESLGIVEQVATFTTNHPCCQNRVVNIQLMADAVRGVVIEPGQTFSLNDHVGRRTAEKGYLPAGGITNGIMVDQLGGGVSQFTTTLFNAAFFAGLDFGEYQSHSIYFSRYPYGREATLSFPHPDLQIRNTTPYGVLIWPTYTDTSITVTLYSTNHITAEQTNQTTSPQGVCTRVRTERTRTWDDGRVEVDAVFAVYRPREGVNCAGESTVPTEPPAEEPTDPDGDDDGPTEPEPPATEPPPTEPPPPEPPPEGG